MTRWRRRSVQCARCRTSTASTLWRTCRSRGWTATWRSPFPMAWWHCQQWPSRHWIWTCWLWRWLLHSSGQKEEELTSELKQREKSDWGGIDGSKVCGQVSGFAHLRLGAIQETRRGWVGVEELYVSWLLSMWRHNSPVLYKKKHYKLLKTYHHHLECT